MPGRGAAGRQRRVSQMAAHRAAAGNATVDYEAFFGAGGSPSGRAGMAPEEEARLRFGACHLIQQGGRLLRMPQSAMVTGQVLVHQFCCIESLYTTNIWEAAMACTMIAGKVEEAYRRVRDVVNVFHWLERGGGAALHGGGARNGAPPPPPLGYVCDEYYERRDRVTRVEMRVLRALGFHVQPRAPIALLANYLRALGLCGARHRRLCQEALSRANDAMRSVAPVCFQPHVIAASAIAAAVRARTAEGAHIALPPDWHVLFDVTAADMTACTAIIDAVYGRAPIVVERLFGACNGARNHARDGPRDACDGAENDALWHCTWRSAPHAMCHGKRLAPPEDSGDESVADVAKGAKQ